MGLFDSGRGVIHAGWWGWMHCADSEIERNIGEELFFQGRDSPGNVNLLGQAATARQGALVREYIVPLTGQAATATPGTALGVETFEFIVDTFTGTNGTAITAHTGELGATWTDAGSVGTAPTIQTNRLKPANDSTGINFYTASGTPSDADVVAAATLYLTAENGSSVDQLDAGVVARWSTTGGGQGYAFGWDAYWQGWAIFKNFGGAGFVLTWINQSTATAHNIGDSQTIEFYVEGTTTPRLRGWVDGILVLDVTDTTDPITTTGAYGVLLGNAEENFAIDKVWFDDYVPAKVQLTGLSAHVRQQRFFSLYDNTTYPSLCFTDDTFTDTDGQWLYSHTGETGATWSIVNDTATWPAFISSNRVQMPNDAGTTYWNTSGAPGLFGADYAVQADFYEPTTNYTNTGIAVRQVDVTGTLYNYSLVLVREYSSGTTYWQLRKCVYGWYNLGTSSSYLPSGATTRKARLEVEGTGSHVYLRAYVDGNLILEYVDTASDRIVAANNAGIHYTLPTSPQIDNFQAGWPSLLPAGVVALTGFSATATKGNLTPESNLVGLSAATAYGQPLPVIDVTPLGRSATTAQGTIVGAPAGNIEVGLTGAAATTAQGALGLEYVYVVLVGQAATASRGDVEQGRSAELVGQVAYAWDGQALPELRFVYDSLTESASVNLTAHTGEVGATWTVAYQTSTNNRFYFPYVNLLMPLGAGVAGSSFTRASGVPTSADQAVAATFQNTAGTGVSGAVSAGVVARMASDGSAGYIFGQNDYDNLWQIEKVGTGVLASTATGILAAYSDISLLFVVTGGATTTLKAYVNGTEVLSVTDSTSPVTAAGYVGVYQREDTSGSPGAFTEFYAVAAGAETSLRLRGQRAASAAGVFDPAARMGYLAGYAATTAQGTLVPRVQIGGQPGTPSPSMVNTVVEDNATNFAGLMSSGFISVNGTLCGVGEVVYFTEVVPELRRGIMKVSQLSRETNPWTNDGYEFGEGDADGLSRPTTGTKHFPRGGTSDSSTAIFNIRPGLNYGQISATPDGALQTLAARAYTSSAGTFAYLAWQAGEYTTPYAGPEVLYAAYDAQSLHASYTIPVGLYAVKATEALVFMPVLRDGVTSGVYTQLVGAALTATPGVLTHTSESTGLELVGLSATARAFDSYRERYSPSWSNATPFPDAKDGVGFLTGLKVTTYAGSATPDYEQYNAPLGYRRLKGGVWGAEVIPAYTGATRSWVIPDSLCVTHSGYGDLVYATYLSSTAVSSQPAMSMVPTHVGLLVMDAVTGTVHSNVLTALSNSTGTWDAFSSAYGRNRSQAEVITLESGESLTQYAQRRNIFKLSWTYGTRTSPTLTVKDSPTASAVAQWESLEIRGEKVYHVFWTQAGSAIYNDATAGNSTWTSIAAAQSGDSIPSDGFESDFFSGYGSGQQTWLFDSRRQYAIFGGVNDVRTVTRWANFWSAQPAEMSVAADGKLGQVGISITPNVALTGQRATTTPGAVFPLVNGDAHAALVGRSLTASAGVVSMPRMVFVYDTFTEGSVTAVTAHTGEVGATWDLTTVGCTPRVLTTGTVDPNVAAAGYLAKAHASGVPPRSAYLVRGMVHNSTAGTQYADMINVGVGARIKDDRTGGYYFGSNDIDHAYYLTKNSASNILASYTPPSGWSGDHVLQIEIFDGNPVHIRCSIDSAVVIEHIDYDEVILDTGFAGFILSGYFSRYAYLDWIEAFYYDPTLTIIDGLRATTAQGELLVTDRSVALMGQAATTAQGTLSPDLTVYVPLTGQAATTAQGTLLLADRTVALTGRSVTATAGELSPQPPIVVALTGIRLLLAQGWPGFGGTKLISLQALGIIGNIGVVVDDEAAAVGHALTTSAGAVTPLVERELLGRSVTTARGVAVPEISTGWWHLPSSLTTAFGIVGYALTTSYQLVGLAATAARGAVVGSTEVSNAPTGQGAAAAAGVLVTEVVVPLAGARAAGAAGGFAPLVAVTPSGAAAVSAQGVMQLLTNIFLTGKQGVCAIGSVAYTYSSRVVLQGVYSTGVLGSTADGFPRLRYDQQLWVVLEPEAETPERESPEVVVVEPPIL